MKLITAQQLTGIRKNELSDLFTCMSRELANTNADTIERAKALASLENISHALALRCR